VTTWDKQLYADQPITASRLTDLPQVTNEDNWYVFFRSTSFDV